jgi:hypothetical protein
MTEHRTDILISRILDRLETPAEWAEFRALAAREPSAWELLAEAQRDNERLQQLALSASRIADSVDLPGSGTRDDANLDSRRFSLRRTFSSGLGWAVAAAVILAWVTSGPFAPFGRGEGQGFGPRSNAGNAVQAAGLLSSDAAWSNYLNSSDAEGTLVGEIEPKVLIGTRERSDGQLEVTFIRQVIERRTVPVLVRPTYDEQGRVTPMLVRPAQRSAY